MAADPSGARGLRRLWWSLAGRVWLTNLALVVLMAALGVLAGSRLAVLERSVNRVLSRNYLSVQAARGMLAAINGLRTGDLGAAQAETDFARWLEVERHNITEPGEARLVARIGEAGARFFAAARDRAAGGDRAGAQRLAGLLAELVRLNEHAMFSADRHTVSVARRLRTEELGLALLALLLLGGSSYLFARTMVARPLGELVATIRAIDDERSLRALSPPAAEELAALAREFNAMVERLQRGYRARLDELMRERSKTRAIIESVEDGLAVLDNAGALVHINEVARAILDLEPDGLIGVTLRELGERNPHVARVIEAVRQGVGEGGAPAELKVFVRGRDHTYLSRELPWTGPGGEPLGRILLLQDVTLIRDQERARTNLIATLSHELKTPLTSLAIGAELVAESMTDGLSPRQRELLGVIVEDVGRLQLIARDLLDASRTSAARIGVERRPILFDRVVREVCATLEIQAAEKTIRLELEGGPEPIPIRGDPIKLPWVITNLVGNALRYTPRGGRITVELRREGAAARAIVTDSGPGIAPDLLPRIFEPYAQFPDHPARAGSAGLGLYIAKEIVEAHNGRIFVRSEPGRGSSFIVEIPVSEEALG